MSVLVTGGAGRLGYLVSKLLNETSNSVKVFDLPGVQWSHVERLPDIIVQKGDITSKEDVMEALKKCIDPEIGVTLLDLGLIYDVKVEGDAVNIKMTLTTRGCPMHSYMINDVKDKVSEVKGVKKVNVELVWDPPWTPEKMSESAKKQLGFE